MSEARVSKGCAENGAKKVYCAMQKSLDCFTRNALQMTKISALLTSGAIDAISIGMPISSLLEEFGRPLEWLGKHYRADAQIKDFLMSNSWFYDGVALGFSFSESLTENLSKLIETIRIFPGDIVRDGLLEYSEVESWDMSGIVAFLESRGIGFKVHLIEGGKLLIGDRFIFAFGNRLFISASYVEVFASTERMLAEVNKLYRLVNND